MELLSLYLSAIDDAHFKVIANANVGQAEADSRLPFFEAGDRWRPTLIKALEVNEFRLSAFQREGELEWMVNQGWLGSDRQSFHPSMLARIGQAMYEALFPVGEMRNVLQRAIARAEENETQLHIRLEFNAEVTKRSRLPDYPWELAHDGQKFLAHHQVRFSRCIAYVATIPKLPAVEKLNVLLVSSGASDEENGLPPLSKQEQKAVLKGLKKAQEENRIQVEVLETASLNGLRVHLTEHPPHVVHFDGHGVFGKRCNQDACRTIHKDLSAKQCKRCRADLPEPQGYLLFETDDDEAEYVSAIELGELLHKTGFGDQPNQRSGTAVAVLSACKSGMALGGESVFNGVAQRLIHHRLPAVVAMQYTVRVDGATQFAEQFYRSLGRKNSLATAVSQGQEAMGAEGNQWYRPVLYLRWQDNEGGQLFAKISSNLASPCSPRNSDSSFYGLIQWISKKSRFLEDLEPCYEDKILGTLRRAELEQLDLTKNEAEILNLLLTYWRFQNNRLPKLKQFRGMSRIEDFIIYLRKMIDMEKFIRSERTISLSNLIRNPEIAGLVKILEKQYDIKRTP